MWLIGLKNTKTKVFLVQNFVLLQKKIEKNNILLKDFFKKIVKK